jgi:Flp pilus assembly protein TadG
VASDAKRDRGGMVAAEFSFIFLAILAVIIGLVEVTWQSTVAAALDRATLRASRFGITGQATRPNTPADITCRSQTIRWLVANATGSILTPERILVTTAAVDSPSDLNGTATPGDGTGGQVVTYNVTYTEPFLTGAWLNILGGPAQLVHHAAVVVKNEAFDNAVC